MLLSSVAELPVPCSPCALKNICSDNNTNKLKKKEKEKLRILNKQEFKSLNQASTTHKIILKPGPC